MASSFQQRSRNRKLIYAGLILLGLTLSYPLRHNFIMAQANDLALRPETKGQVELTGSAVRLSLTGSRGLAVCFLWIAAQEKKKKHEWHELDLIVRSVVKLQPYFITPWLFQSWNVAFNVSVECDRLRDKYFWICNGIQLLAEGERRNRGSASLAGNPDLRFHMGLYYQLKIGRSDENLTMRSLYQLSCIKPEERDPKPLLEGEGSTRQVNVAAFERFCMRHPRLVRRLREQLHFGSPLKVIDFLRDNWDIPSRYDAGTNKLRLNAEDRFPILPPRSRNSDPGTEPFDEDKRDVTDPDSDFGTPLGDDFDNFVAARAWYTYAQEPLPPADPEFGVSGWDIDPSRYRLPRMSQFLFRQYPALAQEFVAQTLAEEGWFDQEGWEIVNKPEEQWTTKAAGALPIKVTTRYSSREAWDRAYQLFRLYGETTRLIMPDEKTGSLAREFEELKRRAQAYRDTYGPDGRKRTLQASERTEELARNYKAYRIVDEMFHYRTITNFSVHLVQAEVEKTKPCVEARKNYYDATLAWEQGKQKQALLLYGRWLKEWTKVLEKNQRFVQENVEIQEDSYEQQLRYLRKVQTYYEDLLKPLFMMTARNGIWPPVLVDRVFTKDNLRVQGAANAVSTLALPSGQGVFLAVSNLGTTSELPPSCQWVVSNTLDEALSEDIKNRLIPSKNIFGPFDPEMRNGRHLFDPGIIRQVRLRVMYAGGRTGAPPVQKSPDAMLPPQGQRPPQP